MIDRLQDALLRIVSRMGLFDIDTLCWWRDAEDAATTAAKETRRRCNIVEAEYLKRRKESRNG